MRSLLAPTRRAIAAGLLCLTGVVVSGPLAVAQNYPHVVPDEPLTPAEQAKKFHLPPGFEIQLVAAEPEVRKPINLNFDQQGRLMFTQSIEYPFAVKDGPGRDIVGLVHGLDTKGRATKVTPLIAGLNIPIGLVAVKNSTLVFSIPNIYRYTKPGEGGLLEQGEKLYGAFDQRDTHGLNNSFVRGLDGWIYACHGFSNQSAVAGADGEKVVMHSGNTYRFKDDGSHVEVFTHGQVNPFGLAFDPAGNVYSTDCHTLPAYQLLRGAWYPSFGKPHDGLGYGPTMIRHSHGSTGIAGIAYYAADQFPKEYRDTLFIGNPITHRVNHDKLKFAGSTPDAIEQPDFLVCDDPWFRPVDVKLGPDGALYIADFYNRIIGHYEVPLTHPQRDRERGRIWRVVYTGKKDSASDKNEVAKSDSTANVDVTKDSADKLIERLADANIVVRTMATHELVDRFPNEAAKLVKTAIAAAESQPTTRVHGLWVLERLKSLDDALVTKLAADSDRDVRVHLLRALAERSDWKQSGLDIPSLARKALEESDPLVRRVAADALGRHPDQANLEPLATLWKNAPAADTHLVHVARIALRDTLIAPSMYEAAAPLVANDDNLRSKLAEVSLGVPSHAAASYLAAAIPAAAKRGQDVAAQVQHAVRYSDDAKLATALCTSDWWQAQKPAQQVSHARAMQKGLQERGQRLPAELTAWAEKSAQEMLTATNSAVQGIELAKEFRLVSLHPEIVRIAQDKARPEAVRYAAIDACVANKPAESLPMLVELLRSLEPLGLRQKAAQALGSVNTADARKALIDHLVVAEVRLASEIAASLASTAVGGQQLLDAMAAGRLSARVLQEPQVVNRLRSSKVKDLDAQLKKLTAGLPSRDERLEQMVQQRLGKFEKAKTDPELGKAVFTKVCAACHKLGGAGNKIGPELDGIGSRGPARLLEDILDPSRNVDQAFRSTTMSLADGRVVSGLVLREEGEVVVLADPLGKDVRVPKGDIETRVVSQVSPMPANVPDLVPETDFYHLLAFLLSQQPPTR